jgi:antitoxin HigA-1
MARTAIHPGEHLAEQLEELGMSAAELARRIKVPTNRVTPVLNGQRAITGDTALRLGHFFGTSAEFWLNLQKLYELRVAERESGKAVKALPMQREAAELPSTLGSGSDHPCRPQATEPERSSTGCARSHNGSLPAFSAKLSSARSVIARPAVRQPPNRSTAFHCCSQSRISRTCASATPTAPLHRISSAQPRGNSNALSSSARQSSTACCSRYARISCHLACGPETASPVHPRTWARSVGGNRSSSDVHSW